MEFGYSLKLGKNNFVDRLNMKCKRKKRVVGKVKVFDVKNGKDRIIINWEEENFGWKSFGGRGKVVLLLKEFYLG